MEPDVNIEEKMSYWMKLKEKINYMKEIITIEPYMACYVIALIVTQPGAMNLEIEKSCRAAAGFNDTICEAIVAGENEHYKNENFKVQEYINNFYTWMLPIQQVVPIIMILFIGSYSDRHKLRIPFLIIPVIGEILATFGSLLNYIYIREWPLEALVLQTLVPFFFGGSVMMRVMSVAYIADVSTLEMRTIRLGVLQIVLNVCTPIFQSFAAPLFEAVGYIGTFLMSIAIFFVGIIYALLYLKEPRSTESIHENEGLLSDIFNPNHIVETFNLISKKKPGNNRKLLLILMIVSVITSLANGGESRVLFLFTQLAFGWNVVPYFYYLTTNTTLQLIGTLITVPLFTKIFNWTDYTIMNVSFLDKIISNVIFAFSTNSFIFYVGVYVAFISTVGGIALRSLATKVVSEQDSGKAQTLFGICEALGETIAGPIYNQSYIRMKEVFPGGFFLFGVGGSIFCSVIILAMYVANRRKIHVQSINVKSHQEKEEIENMVTRI